MKVYGEKILTKPYPCRFPNIQEKTKDGKYQIEIVVPMAEAKEVQDLLYSDVAKVIDFNKASANAKVPKKLYVPFYLYNEELKERVLDEEGEPVPSKDFVIFRFKSQYKPKIQFKKPLDPRSKVGKDSLIQIAGNIFGTDEAKDDKGAPLKYVLLTLNGVRVHTVVAPIAGEVFEESDDFEDAESTGNEADAGYSESEATEEAPANNGAPQGKKQF